MSTPIDLFTPVLIAYCGERVNDKGQRMVALQLVAPNGELEGSELWFAYKRAYVRSIGGVYEGASILRKDDGAISVRGLDVLRYHSRLEDEGKRIELQALDAQADKAIHRQKMEAAGRVNDIERILLPLRREHTKMMKRGAYGPAAALREAVMTALQVPLRKTEEDE